MFFYIDLFVVKNILISFVKNILGLPELYTMKTFYKLNLLLLILLTLQPFCQPAYALGYIITFSGSGAASSVQSVEVQNLTKGTAVTVPAGSTLKLYDGTTTAVDNAISASGDMQLFPNPVVDHARASFPVKEQGPACIRLIGSDGKILSEKNCNLPAGKTEMTLTVPAGLYTLQVSGIGYTYAAKVVGTTPMIKSSITITKTDFVKSGVKQQPETPQVSMLFNQGDRLLYKGVSGNYRTIVVDVPTVSKTVDFNFVECKDGDSNYYTVVQIGSQLWTAENLKTTRYRNGELITNVTDKDLWGTITYSAFCHVMNDVNLSAVYGCWYNFYAVSDSRNLAPIGWHIASDDEWTTLISGLGNSKLAGAKLKETGNTHWVSTNDASTNEVGFSAIPGGFRVSYPGFYTSTYGQEAYWWTSTETTNGATYRELMMQSTSNYKSIDTDKKYGMGVRLVHD